VDYGDTGRMDFLTGSISGKVYLYRRKPNGTFASPEVLKKEVSGLLGSGAAALNVGAPSAVAMADWFGRGKLDLFIGTGDGSVFLVPNEGTRQKPRFTHAERLKAAGKYITADEGMAGPFIADWDGDGKLDLVVGCGSGRVVWYRNVGTKAQPSLANGVTLVEAFRDSQDPGAFANPKRSATNAKVCVADWNGDGRPDLIVGDYSLGRVGNEYRAHGWVWVYLRRGQAAEAAIVP
jgi:hypothetical protein